MSKCYFKVKSEHLTNELISQSLVKNIYRCNRTTDGKYVMLTYLDSQIPVELFKLGYSALDNAGANTELATADWPDEETTAAIIYSMADHDIDNSALSVNIKMATDGMAQSLHEIEFETSIVGGAIHDKDINDDDHGWSSVKFYKDVAGTETEWTPANQADLDTNCIRTDFSWAPDVDYMIKGGHISQKVTPAQDVYVWAVGVDLDPGFGGPQNTFLDGGLNISYEAPLQLVGLEGVSGTMLYKDKIRMPDGSFTQLVEGVGTNRIRFIIRHPAGFNHKLQAVFNIFR